MNNASGTRSGRSSRDPMDIALVFLMIGAASAVVGSAFVVGGWMDLTSSQLDALGIVASGTGTLMLVAVTWSLYQATKGLADSSHHLRLLQEAEITRQRPRLTVEILQSDTGFIDFVVTNLGGLPTSVDAVIVEREGEEITIDSINRTDGEPTGNRMILGHGRAEFRGHLEAYTRIDYGEPVELLVVPTEGETASRTFNWGPSVDD